MRMPSNFHEEIELLQQDIAQILTKMSFMIDGFDVDLACELEQHPNDQIESLYKSLEIAQEACFRFRELKAIDLPAIVQETLNRSGHTSTNSESPKPNEESFETQFINFIRFFS